MPRSYGQRLALSTLVLGLDGSAVGRGCVALMLPGIYKGRALPLCRPVRQGRKGHSPKALQVALIERLQETIPARVSVVIVGDGDFDGTGLQDAMARAGGSYVCRTGTHLRATRQGETFRPGATGACLKPGRLVGLKVAGSICTNPISPIPSASLTRSACGRCRNWES